MVAGRGLLPLFLCHALCFIFLTLFSGVTPSEEVVRSSFVRIRRIKRDFFNISYFGDRMFDDEAEAEAGGDIQEKLVVRGQVVILECLERDEKEQKLKIKIKDTHSDAAVRWFHNDKEVKPDLRVTWSVGGRLRISHAVSSDSGVWRCRKEGYFRRPLRLIVTIPPERPFLVYGGAQLAEGARLTTRAGNALTLHCVVEGGNPAPSVAWFLNEKEITSNSTMRNEWRGPEDQFASVSNVTIIRVLKSHHNASVVCRVVHPALSRPHTSHLKLNIEYPPDFRLRRWPVWGSPLREGSSVSLLCHVDSNPPSLPIWIRESGGKEDEVGSIEGWLNFTDVQSEHRGWYKCATNHPFGFYSSHSVFINVLPPLTPSKTGGDDARVGASRLGDSASQGGQASQDLQAGHDPCTSSSGSSSLCWHTIGASSKDDEFESPITQQYPLRQKEQDSPEGGAPDVAHSNCPSHAEEGGADSSSSSNFIWKSDIKIKVMNRTHSALEGGPAMLTAHVCGSPISADQVTWFPPSRAIPLTPGKSYGRWTAFNLSSLDSQKCVLSNLHIVPVVGFNDAGPWVILVINSLSAHAAVVQLNVSAAGAAKSLAAAAAAASEINAAATSEKFHFVLSSAILLLVSSISVAVISRHVAYPGTIL